MTLLASPSPCLVIFGPTASGKSDLALALADRYRGTIINADSMQIYKDLRLLTARPSVEDETAQPHRLYGVLDGDQVCSAADWRALALAEINAVLAEGRVPILCGGTGFYLKAMVEGLSPMPEIPPDLRVDVRARVEALPGAEAWDWLQRIDPVAAARIEPMDKQRISRALEVFESTGRPLTDWQAQPLSGPPPGLAFTTFALNPPRDVLRSRCDLRFDWMMERGALEEVETLLTRNLPSDRPLMRAVGVPELAAYIRGELPRDDAVARAKAATRQYAKRQSTWLKNQIITSFSKNEQFSKRSEGDFFAFIEENGLIKV